MAVRDIHFRGPATYVSDLTRSRWFYEDVLGLEVSRVMTRDGKPIAIAFAEGLSIWDVNDAFQAIFESSEPTSPDLRRPGWENAFEAEDIQSIHHRAMTANSRFVHSLREHHWGQRTFRVYDPDGNIVDIGETHAATVRRMISEGFSHEQAAERISLPLETVEQFSRGAEE